MLSKVRKLNWMLQESPTGAFSFDEMCELMSELMDANVYIANRTGKVIGVGYKIKSDSMAISDAETGSQVFPEEYNEELMRVRETVANVSGEEALKIFKYDYDIGQAPYYNSDIRRRKEMGNTDTYEIHS